MASQNYVQQISVFIENRPGRAAAICDLLEREGINVRGFMISDTNDYGILRFVVDKPDAALEVLGRAGHAASCKPILVARLIDEPGNLSRLLGHLADAGIDVTYCYSLISTFVAISAPDIEKAWQPACKAGIDLVTPDQLNQGLA